MGGISTINKMKRIVSSCCKCLYSDTEARLSTPNSNRRSMHVLRGKVNATTDLKILPEIEENSQYSDGNAKNVLSEENKNEKKDIPTKKVKQKQELDISPALLQPHTLGVEVNIESAKEEEKEAFLQYKFPRKNSQ